MHELSPEDELYVVTLKFIMNITYEKQYVFRFPRRDGNTEFYYQVLDRVWDAWKDGDLSKNYGATYTQQEKHTLLRQYLEDRRILDHLVLNKRITDYMKTSS